ncbi:MAG TPA: cohesin domain-containing protein [Rhizomicrobium sp.]|jgi:general secretion pathway protein D
MSFLNRLTALIVSFALLAPIAPLEARTKKGDKFFSQARVEEAKKNWDGALENYEKAMAEDPAELSYSMAADKARFQAAQGHIDQGLKVRGQGLLGDALLEFQRAYAINPGSSIASQELQETQQMIQRERQRVEQTGKEAAPEIRALTPAQEAEKKENDRIERMLPIPELRQLKPGQIDLKMTGKTKTLFETVGALADPPINVLWDPDFQPPQHDNFSVDIKNLTLDQALDYLSILTKSFWKPLSSNTIFVTMDNQNKRRDYEEQVLKTIYLHNVSGTTEFQEVVNAVRTVPELTKVFPDTTQYAIVLKGEADRVALAEKIAHDLDKPRPEVLFDFLIMEASSTFSKQITAAIASTGLNVPIAFTPRASIQVQGTTSTSTSSTSSSTSTSTTTNTNPIDTTGTGTTGTSTTGSAIPLSSLGHLASADFSTTLPGALLQAAMSDAKTTVLQAPEMRCIDNVKATLNIGQREPTASGSFQPGIGGVGINPLVNTQFQYLDIGVNIEALARIHSDTEVTVHMLLNITTIAGQVNLGGINQPIIGQRKIEHDLRIKEGEVALLGGLVTKQDDKTITGIPGLSAIPLLGNLFKGWSVDHNRDDIVIAVIPHIIRKPEITAENQRAIAVGTQAIKVTYAPPPAEEGGAGSPGGAPGGPGGPLAGAPPATAPPIGAAPGALGMPATTSAATTPATMSPATIPSTGSPASTPPIGPAGANTPRMPAMPGLPGAPPATAPVTSTTASGMPPATAPPATAPPATAPPATATSTDAPQAGGVAVRFSSKSMDASNGKTFTVSLVTDNAADLAAAPIDLQFDPKLLRLDDIASGDLLKQGGALPLLTKNVQNESGRASIRIARQPGAAGATGSGAIVTLTFSAIAPGDAQVSAQNVALTNSQGQPAGTGSASVAVHIK